MKVIAVVCDLKGSRKVRHPEEFAAKLDVTFRRLNKKHAALLAAPLEVQKGIDEFGCLLKPNAPFGQFLVDLWMDLHPHSVRMSLAKGEATPLSNSQTHSIRLVSGPVLHDAADQLERVQSQGRLVAFSFRPSTPAAVLAEHLGNLLYSTVLGLTARQLEYFRLFLAGKTQSEIAEDLSLSQPTISIALHRMNARLVGPALHDWIATAPGVLLDD